MSRTRRRTLTATLAVLAALVSGAALAWACTPQANIGLNVSSGPPGTQVVVAGRDFAPGGAVAITWNGGPVLATATGPSFSVTVTIPNSPADTHTIVAVGREINGAEAGRARASFTIEGVQPTPARDTTPEPAGGRAGSSGSSSGATSGGEATGRARSGATASGGERTATVRGGDGTTAGAGATSDGAGTSDGALAGSGSVFADSTARSQGQGAAAIPARSPRSADAPSDRSAAASLWSGFAKGSTPSLAGIAGESEDGSVPALTLALVGLAMAALMAGAGVAGARRRRASAHSRRTTGSG